MSKARFFCLAFAFAALVISSPSRAEDYSSGNYWLPICQSTGGTQNMQCLAYVKGVWDGMTLIQQLSNSAQYFCVPRQVTVGQVRDVFVKYLVDNPKHRHMSGDVLFMTALIQSYPCAKAKQ